MKLLLWAGVIGLAIVLCGCARQAGGPTIVQPPEEKPLTIECAAGESVLAVRYSFTNMQNHDVWVCDNVDASGAYGEGRAAMRYADSCIRLLLKGTTVPSTQEMFDPLVGHYIRLGPGMTTQGEFRFALPVVQPWDSSTAHPARPALITRVEFELGVINEDLSSVRDRQVRAKGMREAEVVYMWVGLDREQVFTASVNGLAIPARLRTGEQK